MPVVSVLLPNYNNAPFLNEAIDSVLNQSFNDFELVIVDDGSSDSSIDIIKKYTDHRIKLILKDSNSGIVDTLNLGLEHCMGKYIIRMDGDDISIPDRFKKLVQFMETHPSIGACGSALKMFGQRNDLLSVNHGSKYLKAGMIHGATVPHAPAIFRKSVLDTHRIKYRNNHPHMEDYDLFLRLKNVTDFENLDEVLYLYRINQHNVTVVNASSRGLRFLDMYKEVIAEMGLEESDSNARLHYQFFQIVPVEFSPGEFNTYIQSVINANRSKIIYPEQELLQIITKCWNTLCCRFIDLDKSNYLLFKKLPLKLSWKTYYYYLRKR